MSTAPWGQSHTYEICSGESVSPLREPGLHCNPPLSMLPDCLFKYLAKGQSYTVSGTGGTINTGPGVEAHDPGPPPRFRRFFFSSYVDKLRKSNIGRRRLLFHCGEEVA